MKTNDGKIFLCSKSQSMSPNHKVMMKIKLMPLLNKETIMSKKKAATVLDHVKPEVWLCHDVCCILCNQSTMVVVNMLRCS